MGIFRKAAIPTRAPIAQAEPHGPSQEDLAWLASENAQVIWNNAVRTFGRAYQTLTQGQLTTRTDVEPLTRQLAAAHAGFAKLAMWGSQPEITVPLRDSCQDIGDALAEGDYQRLMTATHMAQSMLLSLMGDEP